MYTFGVIVCAMVAVFGGFAFIGEKIVNYWMEKKGVTWDDEY